MTNGQARSGSPAKRAEQDAAANKDGASKSARGVAESGKAMVIYHEMKAKEDFDDTVETIFQMVRDCAAKYPGKARHLYLDVEGHRNTAGGFDHDAYELITHFVHGYLMQWLTETHTPLGTYRNPSQREDVPDGLDIMPGGDSAKREEVLRQNAEAMGQPIYDSETGEMVDADGTRRPSRG